MRNSNKKHYLLLMFAGVLSLVQACGLIKVPGQSDFDPVEEDRPLEVPPDLDEPTQNTALRVPGTSFSKVSGNTTQSPSQIVDESRDDASTDSKTRLVWRSGSRALFIADDVNSAYRRVGLALQRVGVGVDSSDQEQRSYTVTYVDEKAKEGRPGVFSRWVLRRKGPEDHSGKYMVTILGEQDSTVVLVVNEEGAAAPASVNEEILNALLERLT